MSGARGATRLVPIGRLLAAILLLLAVVPALLAAWVLSRTADDATESLAGKVLTQVAATVQTGSEAQLQQAHDVLNGLAPARPSPRELDRLRRWLREPERFEAMAFALARQSADVARVHVGTRRGEYLGVALGAAGERVTVRAATDSAPTVYTVDGPGDRSRPAPADRNFEPRSTVWYAGALKARERVFSDAQVDVDGRSLLVTLSQPVFEADGGAAGVLAAELRLQHLTELLRTQRISAHGAAYVFDERGQLVASSAGDALLDASHRRQSPAQSANPVIRASHAALQAVRASRAADTVAMNTALQRLPSGDDHLLAVQRPFGEPLGLGWTLVVAAPESDFTGDLRHGRTVALSLLAGLLALGALVAFLVARQLGRRLHALSDAAMRIGRGEVPQVDDRTRVRELHDLSQVLHDTAGQLAAYRERVAQDARALQDANAGLEQRVQERTAELAASREEALAAARAKAAFLATMSHEIRTPLNGVVGMGTLLGETSLDAEQRDYLQTIRVSSDQLLAVINDILDFSKIESGKLDLEREPLAVRTAIEEACDIAAPRAREKGLELIIDVEHEGPGAVPAAILGDVTRLRQVLINLVNNAVKFTAQGEVGVHVRCLRADDGQGCCELEVRVTDTGIGIPPERVGALFDAFTQVDASTTRKYGGTGLGLAICKRLVELMGGRIGVESTPGRGSTFWFTLFAPVAELAQPAPPVGVLAGARVLVVDDHATNVRILTRQLQLWGMEVASAASGRQALRDLEAMATPPQLVITDMHMPEMDGVEFARTLRDDPRWAGLRIVLLTSGFMPAADAGAGLFDARLLKPVRQAQLVDTLSRCLAPEGLAERQASRLRLAPAGVPVLVADDNAVNLKVATAMLAKLGYQVLTAVDGREAVDGVAQAAARGQPVAAVLMDLNMPDVDGLQATRQILGAWGDRAPPVIALTAAASAEDRARCAAVGMVDYLTKPLQVGALAQALERWVAPAAPQPAPAPRSAADDRELVDRGRLEEFKEFDDGQLTMTREVLALFLGSGDERVQAIERAAAAGDAPDVARAAHALKGAAANVGAVGLQHACGALEDACAQGLPADAARRASDIRALWERTSVAMADWP